MRNIAVAGGLLQMVAFGVNSLSIDPYRKGTSALRDLQ
jgi:hypothetical protein